MLKYRYIRGYLLLTFQIQILEEPLEVMSSPHHILSTHRTVHNSGITVTADKVTFRALEHSGLSPELDQTNGTLWNFTEEVSPLNHFLDDVTKINPRGLKENLHHLHLLVPQGDHDWSVSVIIPDVPVHSLILAQEFHTLDAEAAEDAA